MYESFFTILSSSDEKQQKLSLDCLLRAGSKELNVYVKPLRNFADDIKFKD